MSGTIVFNYRCEWSASSGIFNWVNEFLIGRVAPGPDRETLRLIDEQNFRWLDIARLTEVGAAQVLVALRAELVPYSQRNLPDTPYREGALGVIQKLAKIAGSDPKRDVDVVRLDIVGKSISRTFRSAYAAEIRLNDDDRLGFKLEEAYIVHRAGQVWEMEPETDDDDQLQACFGPLYGIPIRRAVAEQTGELWVSFVGGATLECGPGDMYEPWAYFDPRGARVWSLVGRRLMVVDPD